MCRSFISIVVILASVSTSNLFLPSHFLKKISIIAPLQEVSISTSQSIAEALKPQQTLTIGYGSFGLSSFGYFLREGQEVDVGTLRFYFSTEAVDLVYVRQESPFSMRAGCVANDITVRWGGQLGGL